MKSASPFRIGMLYGAFLAAIAFLLSSLQIAWGFSSSNLIVAALEVVALLAVAFIAGFVAGKQTGRVRNGLVAGLWTGIIGVAGLLILDTISFGLFVAHEDFGVTISDSISQFAYPPYLAIIAICGMLGLGIGALGGAFGRARA